MFNIGIIDDEKHARDILTELINKILIEMTIDYRIYKYEKAEDFFCDKRIDFDLIFLDIEIGESNGIDISKRMYEQNMKSIIVFVTSYEGYVRDAFGLNVYGYVMKDEIEQKIPGIITKIITDLEKKSYIIVNTEYGPTTVKYSDIEYFMIEDRKFYLKTKKEMIRFFATTLKGVKEELNNQFLQPNSKYIINAEHIKAIENSAVVMDNDDCIFISRGKTKQFIEMYKDYLMGDY